MEPKALLKQQLASYNVYSSPFLELQTPFTSWELAKMALLIWTVPLRIAIGLSAAGLLAICSYLIAFDQDIDLPFGPGRRKCVVASSKLARVVLFALGVQIRVTGYDNYWKARKLGAMGVFHHTSWVDSILMMWLFAPSGVALQKIRDLPLVGTCIKAFQNIYVPRDSDSPAADLSNKPQSVSDLVRKRALDRRFPMLMMAPEGTCGDGRSVLLFRSGCFLPGVPLLPILITYDKTCHNPAWTIINEGWHFLRLVCQFRVTAEVRILPPYIPSEEERAKPQIFSKNIRQLFHKELGLRLSEEGVAHFRALTKSGIRVSLDGRAVIGPPGLIDAAGRADLSKYL